MNQDFLKIENISKSFGDIKVLDGVNLTISQSEFFGLLGASGSGKTTLLRILGGFEKPDTGKIYLDGLDITNLEPFDRPLNYMFQSYALFPHLNVFNNLSFGIKDNFLKNEVILKVDKIANLLSIQNLLKRRISQLSGGEQQRVALGRCLIKEPKLLLLDEPLAALDKKLRTKTQLELTSLQKKLDLTFIFVTHDQEEAMSLSDKMAIMQNGKILECNTPMNIYETPKTRYAANFLGNANIFEIEKQNSVFISQELNIDVFFNKKIELKSFYILVRPEKIKIQLLDSNREIPKNSFKGKIIAKSYLGSFTNYEIKSQNKIISVFDQNNKKSNQNLLMGQDVLCSWLEDSIVILED